MQSSDPQQSDHIDSQSHLVKVRLDVRERGLIENLDLSTYSNIVYTKESLDVGDIIIESDNLSFVFERKTITDLAQSIKDKRYHDQKSRLLSTYPAQQVYYIIEGNMNFQPTFSCCGLGNEVLTSCLLSSMLRDKIGVFATKNLADTICLIEGIIRRLSKDPMKYSQGGVKSTHHVLSSYVVKTKKKDNVDKHGLFLIQLSAIPGVSLKLAERIASHLKVDSLFDLFQQLKDQDKKSVIDVFREIPGIGTGLATLLYNNLF